MTSVKTCISLSEKDFRFIKSNGYSPSGLLHLHIEKLIKKSEGRGVQSQPTDEPHVGGSNE